MLSSSSWSERLPTSLPSRLKVRMEVFCCSTLIRVSVLRWQFGKKTPNATHNRNAEAGIALPAPGSALLAKLQLNEELALIKLLTQYPEVVNTAACICEPHRLTTYLQEVAGLFHSYYNSHRVLVDDAETSAARLYLVNAVRHVLANALSLLGINAPERM
jgi:hypothetical protein